MNSIGLFGGTFDPVHNGHVALAEAFLQSNLIDELWIILTPFPPHKQEKDHTTYANRLKMLELAFENLPVKISTIEDDLPKPSFTFRTIRHLKELHPDTKFYFCMGEDSLEKFHTWKEHEKILTESHLLVARRPEATHDEVNEEILTQTIFVDHSPIPISSSEVKDKIAQGSPFKSLIPESVYNFIEKEELYR